MTRPRLAVWDVDGTLIDSRAVIYECCKHALVQADLPEPTYDEVRQIVGLSLGHALSILAPGLDAARAAQVEADYKAKFREHRASGAMEPLYDGAAETLERLKAQGWLMAIATGKSRAGVDSIVALHGWAALFGSTHCSDDGPGKPHPAMVIEAMRAAGAAPHETIVIGDTAHDMRMAKAAGARAQGVNWGFHTAEEILAGGADHVAGDFASLNGRLDEFSEMVV